MRTTLFIAILCLTATAHAEPRLAWLEGRWTGTRDGVASEEIWSSPAGGALLGMHKDVKDGRLVGFEQLRIARDGDTLVYFASPQGAAATRFRLVELAERRVVFGNPKHDFPQRILYWLDAAGALHARVEGEIGGKPRAVEWVWTRTP
jgi:hypothetical protein